MSFAATERSPLPGWPRMSAGDPMIVAQSMAAASAAIARLDQASGSHPLAQAFLFRARLDAVRRMAAVDGALIDPWHLAASLERLRLRMDPFLTMMDREDILDRARVALALHQWIADPDFDQEGEVQRAEAVLTQHASSRPPLLAAAEGFRTWIDAGESRAPARAAMIRFWRKRHLLRLPIPLTGAAALRSEQSWELDLWLPAFLQALEREAGDVLDLLYSMEHAWFAARRTVTRRRRDSHDAAAIDVLAATPMLSATTLAAILKIAVRTAIRILDGLVAAGVAVEVTHRSKRRLFGLQGLAPLREIVRPPRRADRDRGRGRPRKEVWEEPVEIAPPLPSQPLAPLTSIERRAFDYTALEEAMAHLDMVVRGSRVGLRSISDRARDFAFNPTPSRAETAPDC